MEECFIKSIPSQHEAVQIALKTLNNQHPERPVVLLSESMFFGSMPGMAGSPGLQPTAYISLGLVPLVLSSVDCPPFGSCLPPDSSPEGRAKNKAMNKNVQEQLLGKAHATYLEIMGSLGVAVSKLPFFMDAPYILPHRFLQMCIPSVEYPRSDAPRNVIFAGGIPKGYRSGYTNPPAWWDEITSNKSKKIILVSQGTVAVNFSDLIIPTMVALKGRDDMIVIVALGRKGASLREGTEVPANVRVGDFVPFDEVLPYCIAFVTNGGYGSFQHAVGNGIPLVIGGTTEDKPEIAARAEWTGIGYNLRTSTPTPEAVLAAVEEVTTNSKYKQRALELKTEMATYDPIKIVSQFIDGLTAGKSKK